MVFLAIRSQNGIAALEAACFTVVLATISLVVFALSSAILAKRSIDSVAAMSISEASGTIFTTSINSNGILNYSFDIQKARILATSVLNDAKRKIDEDSFIRNLPHKIDISLYQISIDPYTGKRQGILGQEIRLSDGTLNLPEFILSKSSIETEKLSYQDYDTTITSLYAEPTSTVLFESVKKNTESFIPITPILIICIYVADKSVAVSNLLATSFPEGIVSSCISTKVRRFI